MVHDNSAAKTLFRFFLNGPVHNMKTCVCIGFTQIDDGIYS